MKRILKLFVLIGLLAITVPCYADSLVVDVDTSDPLTDVNASYWFGSDANPAVDPIGSEVGNKLVNSDPETEEAWLEALLGYVYDNPGVNYLDRIVAGQGGLGDSVKSINDFNPGFAWTWAVVKLGNNWVAYEDTGSDDLLTTIPVEELPVLGISHISFFGNGSEVPIPAAVWLFGTGLLGLVGVRRRMTKA